jgi:cell shape-determining protein MreC
MGRSNLKLFNQKREIRTRHQKILEYEQTLNKYYKLYIQEKHHLQQLGTDRIHRDNVVADVRTPSFLRQSLRLRNLEARIQHTQQQINRIRGLDHYN